VDLKLLSLGQARDQALQVYLFRDRVHFKCTRSAIKYTRGVSLRVRVHKAFWPVKMKAKRTYVHYGKIDTSSRTLGFHCKNEGKRLRAQREPSNLTILELF